jgi:nucleoside-diphosphate kinase
MSSGSCVPMAVEGEDAVAGIREIIGATDPAKALPGTIRKDLAENVTRNAVHASDSVENAAVEIGFFFDGKSLTSNLV